VRSIVERNHQQGKLKLLLEDCTTAEQQLFKKGLKLRPGTSEHKQWFQELLEIASRRHLTNYQISLLADVTERTIYDWKSELKGKTSKKRK